MIMDGQVGRTARWLGLEVDGVKYAESLLRIDAHLFLMQCVCVCVFLQGFYMSVITRGGDGLRGNALFVIRRCVRPARV